MDATWQLVLEGKDALNAQTFENLINWNSNKDF